MAYARCILDPTPALGLLVRVLAGAGAGSGGSHAGMSPGEIFDPYVAGLAGAGAGGIAGIGAVRARSMLHAAEQGGGVCGCA